MQVGGKGGWMETHNTDGSPAGIVTTPAGMLGVNEDWRPPLGLPFGGNIASKPLKPSSAPVEEASQAAALENKLHHVQALMNSQWTGVPSQAGGWGKIPNELLAALNQPLAHREQRQEAESAARAAMKTAEASLGMTVNAYGSYGDVAQLQRPVVNSAFKKEVQQASAAIDAALESKIVSHSDDPASPDDRGAVSLAPVESKVQPASVKPPKTLTPSAAQLGGAQAMVGVVSEVARLKRRLKRQRDANQRLERKLSKAKEEGFGYTYAKQLRQEEQRVASAVACCCASVSVSESASASVS